MNPSRSPFLGRYKMLVLNVASAHAWNTTARFSPAVVCGYLWLLVAFALPVSAQMTLSGLTEVQRGEVPGSDSTAISTAYNQFNIDFTQRGLQAGLRAEVYNTWGADRETYQITQKYARWNNGTARLEIGNYYAILGRGLTLRAFELPGVVLESASYRLRYSPVQDLEGAIAAWTGDRLEAQALIGRPALSDIPPGAKTGRPPRGVSRRGDWVAGGEFAARLFSNFRIGSTGVHIAPRDSLVANNWAWSGFADFDLSPLLGDTGLYGNFYGEYARRGSGVDVDLGPDAGENGGEYARRESGVDGHGLYVSGNVGGAHLGLSVEYKRYDNMALGFNDPPSLIRENTAFLLNRATHVLLLTNEQGYQIEATYTRPELGNFTANVSYARNDLAPTVQTFFKERHLAFDLYKFDNLNATIFFNWGKDDLNNIDAHRTTGAVLETTLGNGHTLGLDMQYQRAVHIENEPSFANAYGVLSFHHNRRGFGAALAIDHTTDPFEVDRVETFEIETGNRTFYSLNLNARFGTHFDAIIFAGERRGGTACTSGTCYQVLPFKGVEMRLNTYF